MLIVRAAYPIRQPYPHTYLKLSGAILKNIDASSPTTAPTPKYRTTVDVDPLMKLGH